MQRLRAGLGWLGGWLALSAVLGAALVAFTLAQGGAIHRVSVCAGRDANIFLLGILAGSVAAIVVLAWWALGARSLRWRWARVIGVAVAIPPIAVAAIVGGGSFSFACMGGPLLR